MSEENTTETQNSEATTETNETVDLASATSGETTAEQTGGEKTDETGEAKTGETAEAKAEETPKPEVPEAYDLKITTTDAEGKESPVELDTKLVEAATPVLKEVGLTNEQANKIAPLAVKVQERMIEQQAEAFEATKADWAKQTQGDPEIGGKHWKETASLVGKALDHFAGGPDKNDDGTFKSGFRQLLVDTGLTNHPDMAKMLRAVGKAIAEDGTFVRSEGPVVKKSREENMYPDDVPKK
jgi:hypothetical protein